MSWFIVALITLLCWGCADLFYKKSSSDSDDKVSHLKIAIMVGVVMGITAVVFLLLPLLDPLFKHLPSGIYDFVSGNLYPEGGFSFINMLEYSPASLMYILSMIIGYAGMRYLEISIISPVQNASGALSSIIMILYFLAVGKISSIGEQMDVLTIIGVVLIVFGMIFLAIVENRIGKTLTKEEKKYRMGALALVFPLLYCLFDTLGTAADGIILDGGDTGFGFVLNLGIDVPFGEIDAIIAYGLTFFMASVVCFLYLLIFKKQLYIPFKEKDKTVAALFENFGQIFYVFAMASNPVVAAPMISSYCIVSVILSRIFLKEKLKLNQYITVGLVIAGIVLLGISEGLSEM